MFFDIEGKIDYDWKYRFFYNHVGKKYAELMEELTGGKLTMVTQAQIDVLLRAAIEDAFRTVDIPLGPEGLSDDVKDSGLD